MADTPPVHRAAMPPPRPKYDVIDMPDQVVTGKVIKPEVMFILSRSDSRFRERPLHASFLYRIQESIKRNPF